MSEQDLEKFIRKVGQLNNLVNSLEKFLILPHHLPKVLNTAGKSFGPTKMIINAAMTRYSTPPIPGNITIT